MASESCCDCFWHIFSPGPSTPAQPTPPCPVDDPGPSTPAQLTPPCPVDNPAPSTPAQPENVIQVYGENVDLDLDRLIDNISHLLKCIKKEKPARKKEIEFWPSSAEGYKKLGEFLSAVIEGASDVKNMLSSDCFSEAKTMAVRLLAGIGHASPFAAGLLLVSFVVERFESISENKDECLRLLKDILALAKLVRQIEEYRPLKEETEEVIKEVIQSIQKGSGMCFAQFDSPNFSKFFKESVNKKNLDGLKIELDSVRCKIYLQMGIELLANNAKQIAPPSRRYPEDTVGLKESVDEVVDLLEWGSSQHFRAVILYGVGGIGKSTLAQAVFSSIDSGGCKYSKVILSKDKSINEVQRKMYEDLAGRKAPTDFGIGGEGQLELGEVLNEVPAFIYIDNVSDEDDLEQLLPENLNKVKKVRLLITSRDKKLAPLCRTKAKSFLVRDLLPREATTLLENKMSIMSANMEGKLNSNQLNQIAHLCGGNPLLLTLAAKALCDAEQEDKQNVYREVKERLEKWKDPKFKNDAMYKVLAYDSLPDICKDPFLDICLFFKGWQWNKVADIVGKYELGKLEARAIVTKDTDGLVTVRDVILRIAYLISEQKTEGIRCKFTSASQLMDFLRDTDEKEIQRIKGIWFCGKGGSLDISAKVLDLMHNSLRILALGEKTEVDVKGKCSKAFQKLVFFQAAVPEIPISFGVSEEIRYLSYKPTKDLNLLEMPSNLTHMEFEFHGKSSAFEISSRVNLSKLKNLRTLKLTNFAKLEGLLQELAVVVNCLQELTLSNCSIKKLPENFGSLNSLQELNLHNCSSLKALPKDVEQLSSLKKLNLSGCKSLEDLPVGLGNLTTLVELNISHCWKLVSIPESIGQLKLLSSMDFTYCKDLKELPEGFCNLSITDLKFTQCGNLKNLPEQFGKLASLRVLTLKKCVILKKLPESFCQLNLVHLDLSGCSGLEELDIDCRCLSSLRTFSLNGCNILVKLPENFHCLRSLQHLYLRDCDKLEGKWMNIVVKTKALELVYIRGSTMLVETWVEMKNQGNQPWSFQVDIGQDFSAEEKVMAWKKLSPKFGRLLEDERGEPLDRPLNTVLLIMFNGSKDFNENFPWPLIEENIDNMPKNLEMIYIGKHFNKLPKKVAKSVMAHARDNSNARMLFEKVLLTLGKDWDDYFWSSFWMTTKVVSDGTGGTYQSFWELLSNDQMKELVQNNCGRHL